MKKRTLYVVSAALLTMVIGGTVRLVSLQHNKSHLSYISAVNIDKKLNQLNNLKTANLRWAKLDHKQVGKIKIGKREYPVYHDRKERMVYVCVPHKSTKQGYRGYSGDQSRITEDLQPYARRLGIWVTLQYASSDNTHELTALINEKPSRYDARINELKKQFDTAIRQVEHKPLYSNGHRHRVLSDPDCRYFVILSPASGIGPKRSEIDAYVTKLAATKGNTWSRMQMEKEQDRWQWLPQPVRRVFRL